MQYQIITIKNGYQQENFYREADDVKEIIDHLRSFQYAGDEFRIYLDDELEAEGTL